MEHQIFQFLSQYAHQPWLVYTSVVAIVFASSFGFPVPEEVTIVSLGLIAFIGNNPELFPSDQPLTGEPINVHTAAWLCFAAVFVSDFIVYSLGRVYGARFIQTRFFRRFIGEDRMNKVFAISQKYGSIAAGAFRFTPGLRFPGHFSCGMLGVRPIHFIAIDGLAALISVPTQVYLIYNFGDTILENLKRFKTFLLIALIFAVISYLLWTKVFKKMRTSQQS